MHEQSLPPKGDRKTIEKYYTPSSKATHSLLYLYSRWTGWRMTNGRLKGRPYEWRDKRLPPVGTAPLRKEIIGETKALLKTLSF